MPLQQEVKMRRNCKQSGQSLLRRMGNLFSPAHTPVCYNCQLLCTGGRRSSPSTGRSTEHLGTDPRWAWLWLDIALGSALALSLAGQAAPLGCMEPQLSPSCPALGSTPATNMRIQRLRPSVSGMGDSRPWGGRGACSDPGRMGDSPCSSTPLDRLAHPCYQDKLEG